MLGCDLNEMAFCRNATEGFDTILRGIDFREGEEVVYGRYDYPFVQNTIKQLEVRLGIKAVGVDYDIAHSTDEEIIGAYHSKINKVSRLLVLSHMLNWNGRVLPVKEITEIARRHDAEILLDGAQSFAHIPFSIEDIRPDYFVACFHKWFRGPLGTAFI
ncbi:MAG: aminotransferase class V-fold PLP-dependent enzyme [Bacteroidales bacterium]|nr:aminotransferase class V-fold PLP-dependent enzyme [Bacteroidales bacterium]MCF8344975.1 aminotransferase class V-fold PLP-dependent enzyme [Bacteroidales bacterium]MCF8350762.1 aminotransferase class V-fold PLP-dependent enzyme [Bacteroidales bacterium]MCF8377171.1 aminotransferase class V-fold PLP-dependent enzyme [Bacteroidales bacterium]